MIEFDGYISGEAKKFYFNRELIFATVISGIGSVVCLSFAIPLAFFLRNLAGVEIWRFLLFYFGLFTLPIFIFCLQNGSLKQKKSDICKVFTDEKYIYSVTGEGDEISRLISQATTVYDYGQFYYVAFPLKTGHTNKFICQKRHLTTGTLEEFEALFEGKIIRKNQD